MRNLEKIGLVLLGIWLIVKGLQSFIDISFTYQNYVMGGLAILAGVFVIIGRRK